MEVPREIPTFQQSDFSFALKDLTLGRVIGDGAFSRVNVAAYFGDVVAVKRQRREQKDIQQYVWRELTVLKELNHPRLLEYIGACEDKESQEIWIITELLPGGDLAKLLESATPLGWKTRIQIAQDAAEGLHFLHSKQVIHRDIKCANILLDGDCRSKLCDFGFARVKPQINVATSNTNEGIRRMSICGTDDYMAPEICFDEEYDECADIYSFGIALMEIITRRKVNKDGFLMRTPQNRFKINMEEFRKAVPPSCPPAFSLLAEQCAAYESYARPSSLELKGRLQEILNEIQDDDIPNPTFPARDFSILNVPRKSKSNDEALQKAGLAQVSMATPISRPYKAGYIYKRNRRGLKAWKERWFVLDGFCLAYYGSPEEANGTKAYTHYGVICLHGMDIALKGSHHRFDLFNNNDDSKRELAGHSHADMMEWVLAIHNGIAYGEEFANEQNNDVEDAARIQNHVNNELKDSRKDIANETPKDSFDMWLKSLGIEHLAIKLRSKGFHSMDYMRQVGDSEVGICEEDLDFLEIHDEKERQILQRGTLDLINNDQPQQ